MFKITNPGCNLLIKHIVKSSVKRYFLSKAYRCDEVWSNRLKNPVFAKINLGNLYHELDINLKKNERISVLDVDVWLNSAEDLSHQNELEDILLRLRLCPESGILPERATHAAIRWYMDNASKEDLFNALSDRLNYGLFPNYHLTNLLIDKYLNENDSRSAVKPAVLQMLQEDVDNPIMKALALYSCYNYLESPDVWVIKKDPEPDDEEVQKVRVRFLRNPYFDDHFDITDTNHLVGKTLWMFGYSVDGTIGVSSQLVGLVLYEKYKECAEFLQEIVKKNTKVHEDAVVKAKEYSLKRPKQAEEEEVKQAEEVKAKQGEEVKAKQGEEEKPIESEDNWKDKVLKLLEKFSEGNLVKGSLLTESCDFLKKTVEENEANDIQQQCEVYQQWEKEREDNINYEIKRAEQQKAASEIEKMKAELKEEEEKLFFFDKNEEYELVAKEKEEEMGKVIYYRERRKKNRKDVSEEVYVPPEVKKKKF